MNQRELVTIVLSCHPADAGRAAGPELVWVGLPFPRGEVRQAAFLELRGPQGEHLPASLFPTGRWPDGSVKWAVAEFFAPIFSGPQCQVALWLNPDGPAVAPSRAVLEERAGVIRVERNGREFLIPKDGSALWNSVALAGVGRVCGPAPVRITLKGGERAGVRAERVQWSESEIVTRVTVSGRVASRRDPRCALFSWTLSIYDELVKVEYTLRNPKAARHYGGLWDLGDPNSLHLEDLSQYLELEPVQRAGYLVEERLQHADSFSLYQGSSGGANSRHPNHMDRTGKVPIDLDGYRISTPQGEVARGSRLDPEVVLEATGFGVAAALEGFWQNFPKQMGVADGRLRLGLFPAEHQAGYELQPGEQKTHRYYLRLAPGAARLGWLHRPLAVQVPPAWFAASGAVPYLGSARESLDPVLEGMIGSLVEGEKSLRERREVIDEYGWRNFGDVFADHEYYECADKPKLCEFASHYNNQYDLLNSLLFQYLKTGSGDWLTLAGDLARHVIDIDIYHTDEDKSEFNNGMLWHTDHFASAHTATHRTFSLATKLARKLGSYGGGPGYDHDYAKGLKLYYFLTGDPGAREAVLDLAEWTRRGIGGIGTLVESLERTVKQTLRPKDPDKFPYSFNGPGRPGGNALNVMLDAFELTGDRGYLARAEELITRCISPDDAIEKRNLLEPNLRWMYTIFLMALESYLQVKRELGEQDRMYRYGAASLRNYACWMARHEVSLFDRVEELDFPNYATRAAQDLRKSTVLLVARKYCTPEEGAALHQRARSIYEKSVGFLAGTENRFLVRPTAVLMAVEGPLKYGMTCVESCEPPATSAEIAAAPAVRSAPTFAEILRYTSLGKEWRAVARRLDEALHTLRRS